MATQYYNQLLSYDDLYPLIWLVSDALWVETGCPETSDWYPVIWHNDRYLDDR